MGKVYRKQRIEGVTIPAIIHNMDYFWDNMAVYEDGTVACWEKTDLSDVPWQLSRGWLTTSVPEGKPLSIFQCCSLKIVSADWNFDNDSFYKFVEDTVRSMNPEMENIYKTTPREKNFWKERHVGFSAEPTFCKVDGRFKFGYDLIDGSEAHIFLHNDGKIQLTELYAYADETFLIDALGEKYFTLDDIERMFADNTLCTAPKDGERVVLGALGEAECEVIHAIDNDDKLSEIRNKSLDAQGKPDAHKICTNAYHAYLTEPSDFNKERLRKAYEAVPEHERCYLGDMDTRDYDFIRILYTDDKREV